MDLIWPTKDTVTIEMPIEVPEYTLSDGTTSNNIPIELVIVKKREMKNIFSNFAHLKKFVGAI